LLVLVEAAAGHPEPGMQERLLDKEVGAWLVISTPATSIEQEDRQHHLQAQRVDGILQALAMLVRFYKVHLDGK